MVFTASSVRRSAAGPSLIKTMRVSSTESGAEQASQDGSEKPALKGLRKRWATKAQTKASGSLDGNESDLETMSRVASGGAELVGSFPSVPKVPKLSESVDKVPVADETSDDFLGMNFSSTAVPASSGHQHEREALLNTNLSVFKYPWEKGRLAAIFQPQPAIKVPIPKLAPGGRNFVQVGLSVGTGGQIASTTVLQPQQRSSSAFVQVVRKVEDVEVEDDRARRRRHALEGFWKLLATSMVSSAVGLKVSVEATSDTVHECALKILDATFAVKSPGTLLRRLYSLQAYKEWCAGAFNADWIPVSERHVWEYVQWLQVTLAAPTKASSLLEALRFAWYLLGVEGADEAEKSLRVKGVTMQMRAKKTPWRPADLLTVQEVLTLHKILGDEGEALGDRLFCGHCLHLLYSRSRWSDLTQVTRVFMDEERKYLELSTKAHKGARSAELKSRLLPIVAPCQGISDQNWAEVYLALRTKANLKLPGAEAYLPMMPAPANDEATIWYKRALTSEEGADFMRKVLAAPKTTERRIATHSFKSTMISWCAKYGLPDTSRAVLARHMSCATATTAVYSRDLLSPVLRELDTMLQAMRCTLFQPDRTRSGMVTPAAMAVVPGTPFKVPPAPTPPAKLGLQQMNQQTEASPMGQSSGDGSWEHAEADKGLFSPANSEVALASEKSDASAGGDADSETTEEDSEQSTSDSDVESECPKPAVAEEPSLNYFINEKSLVIHRERIPGLLKCGRKISPHFIIVYELHGIRCSRCFDV